MVLLRFRLQDKPTNQPTWCHMDWWWVVLLLVEGWKWSGHKHEQVGRSCDVGLKKHTCCFLYSSAFCFANNRHFCGSLATPNKDGLTVWPQTESTPSRRNSQLWRRSCEQHWPLNRNGADGWWLMADGWFFQHFCDCDWQGDPQCPKWRRTGHELWKPLRIVWMRTSGGSTWCRYEGKTCDQGEMIQLRLR